MPTEALELLSQLADTLAKPGPKPTYSDGAYPGERLELPDAEIHAGQPKPPQAAEERKQPHARYLAEAKHMFETWAHKLQLLEDTRHQLEETERDLHQVRALVVERSDTVRRLEGELASSREREAKALEQIGMLKGVMQTHGASIADVVRGLGNGS